MKLYNSCQGIESGEGIYHTCSFIQNIMINYNKLNHTVWEIFPRRKSKIFFKLNVVDVGARNGMFLLPEEYSKLSHLIGFEPNKIEYKIIKIKKWIL